MVSIYIEMEHKNFVVFVDVIVVLPAVVSEQIKDFCNPSFLSYSLNDVWTSDFLQNTK